MATQEEEASATSETQQQQLLLYTARDGLLYKTYEEMRNANIRLNEQKLFELGLVSSSASTPWKEEFQNNRDGTTKTKNKGKKRNRLSSSSSNTEPLRRSGRTRTVIAREVVVSLTTEEEAAGNNSKKPIINNKKPIKKQKRRIVVDDYCWGCPLMKELRAKLAADQVKKDDNDWFVQFQQFWKPPKISQQNYRTILRQVTKLVNGSGIDYQHWPIGISFQKNQKINMSTDFEKLYELANQYEDTYGPDLGHGWLVKIPLRKLAIFQRHYFETMLGCANNKETEDDDLISEPFFPIGTRFQKEFPGYDGIFEGEVKSFVNGRYYKVYYPVDGDKEELSESELKELKILTTPLPPATTTAREEITMTETSTTTPTTNNNKPKPTKTKEPKFAVGTTFVKPFPGHRGGADNDGMFIGQVEGFDGTYYKVFYPSDGDREDLTEFELSALLFLYNNDDDDHDVVEAISRTTTGSTTSYSPVV